MELKEEFKIKDEKILDLLKDAKKINIDREDQIFIQETSRTQKRAKYNAGLKEKIKTYLKFEEIMNPEQLIKYSILRDVILIHSFGYRVFINRCMGQSKSGGFFNKENIY